MTAEELAKENAAKQKDQDKWSKKGQKLSDRYWASRDMDGYFEGRKAADAIGLDTQIASKGPVTTLN